MTLNDSTLLHSVVQSYDTTLAKQCPAETVDDRRLPHDEKLLEALDRIGMKRLAGRRKEAQRLLRENGATHNVFDLFEAPRTWQFDPVPLIINAQEWQQIEAGLIQRAELLNRILADIYGPRRLLEKGLLPPELVFTHRGFLWPCADLLPPDQRHLNVYSANLTRGRDGRFWVLEDRSMPQRGSGYALENRIVLTRSFPRLFQDFQVHRLAMYYRALRNSLSLMARHNRNDPRIVVLTPGPEDPTYFEHAYFAGYLGYPLIQGGDLIARNGCVWMKSLGGLRQVDVIIRRLEDERCDPLELRGDSLFGIPGLLEAIRLGNVVTANAIGSGVLENPALLAFLPGLCRQLLGEELKLPSIATWWCGQARERDFVLNNLEKLIVRPIHPIVGVKDLVPGQGSHAQRTSWRNRILAQPYLYVGQEPACPATSPSFVSDKIESRPCIFSAFLTAHDGSYMVMPGGLARSNIKTSDPHVVSLEGEICKDTWVLTAEPDKQVNLWRQAQPNQLIEPLLGPMPSRTAENLFWAARYAERTEATARLLRSILLKLRESNEFHDPDDRENLHYLLRALTHVTSTFPGFVGKNAEELLADPRGELLSLAKDIERPGSLRASLRGLRRSTYAVRDQLPADAWRVVDNMQQHWNPRLTRYQIGSGRLHESISQLILQLVAFSGLTHENMSRETAWLMLNIGRRLERAQNLINLLRATLVPCYAPNVEAQMMETVLATSNSLIVFRRRYRSFMQLSTVLELLLMDDNYPRSLAYQLCQLQQHLNELPREKLTTRPQADEKVITEAATRLKQANCKVMTQTSGTSGTYLLLEDLLLEQKNSLNQFSTALTQLYFSPTQVPQQLNSLVRDMAS